MKRQIILFFCLLSLVARGQTPLTNPIWSRWGDMTGVIYPTTGIPTNITTMYKNVVKDLGVDNTGAVDCWSVCNTAMNACPANQYLYFPPGTYKVGGVFHVRYANSFVIRGAGMGQTIFKPTTGGSYVFDIGTSENPRPSATTLVKGGATAGSSTITVASVGGNFPISRLMRIEQVDPAMVHNHTSISNCNSVMVSVYATNATTITFWPPLPFSFTNATYCVSYPRYLLSDVGLENFTIELTNTTDSGILLEQTVNCWISNVEVAHAYARNIVVDVGMNDEVFGCYTHDVNYTAGFSNHEGIDLYENACFCRIHNNICSQGGYPAIILGDAAGGCVGNVIAYNFVTNDTTIVTSFSDNHGPQNCFNLFEGNVGKCFTSDGYYGSSAYDTIFRNYFSANWTNSYTEFGFAIQLNHWAYSNNVVGNVLGYSGIKSSVGAIYASTNVNETTLRMITVGYPNPGNTYYNGYTSFPDHPEVNPVGGIGGAYDFGVSNTLNLTGNYDYVNNATQWDPKNAARTITNSLYLATQPSWWDGSSWPPIGPDLSPMVNIIPAQKRFLTMTGSRPPTPTGFHRVN